MLELSEKEFKITVINMLRALIEKADKKEHISKVIRETETLIKNKREMLLDFT